MGGTFYAAKAQLEAWLEGAAPGHSAVYAKGPSLDPRHEVVILVKDWIATGEVNPVQRRVDGELVYQVQRRAAGPDAIDGVTRRLRLSEAEAETPEGKLLTHLSRLANLGLPCPSNAEIAEAIGWRDGEAVRYRFNNLKKAGQIDVAISGERRVVLIVATGKRTASSHRPAAEGGGGSNVRFAAMPPAGGDR